MTQFKTAIVGYGFVGKTVHQVFPKSIICTIDSNEWIKADVNRCGVAFVCVPTPMNKDKSCHTAIVEEVIDWIETPLIIIRSTISPGTTDRLQKKYPNKGIVFQPEYIGETVDHPLIDEGNQKFIILGGELEACSKAVELYQSVYNSSIRIMLLSAVQAEIVKYMENTAIASMVTLVNEYYNICKAFDVDYHMVREAFLLDPRMSRYFTFVYPRARGFSGKCLPKDLNAIVKAAQDKGYNAMFIASILDCNDTVEEREVE
jgi:UDPglucose 6-dehydrogenase